MTLSKFWDVQNAAFWAALPGYPKGIVDAYRTWTVVTAEVQVGERSYSFNGFGDDYKTIEEKYQNADRSSLSACFDQDDQIGSYNINYSYNGETTTVTIWAKSEQVFDAVIAALKR